ncbi:hypothetical protein Ate01nite_12710 [Actinoplanes teichomyceticus]|nr:hypothetical protein Ate01nite_12710 [Actinoplanes teichomyceticus]
MRHTAPVVAALLLIAGCTGGTATESPADPADPSPFAACPALSGGGADLPDVSLACFTGGGRVRLADLRGPAVINIWASYCGPCRTELPVMQRLADRTAGRLTVLGVDSGDTRGAAASFAADHGITMPNLFDPEHRLADGVGTVTLPSTIFIGADGKRYVHRYPMDAAELSRQLREHTGIEVAL